MTTHYLACDLGAESGRLISATLQGAHLSMDEVHRFPNTPDRSQGSLHWNIPQLYAELQNGLGHAATRQVRYESISTDSWGVDYVLQAKDGSLRPPAFHYRDTRCHRGVEKAHARLSWEQIFAEGGVQFMPFNSLYQLMAEEPGRLEQAHRLLGIGDAFNYLLCGVARAEVSFASTTALYNPCARQWSHELINKLSLPPTLFPPVVASGTVLGPLLASPRLPNLQVIASCSHDTGAAVAAVPAADKNWAYLSSGTWSLMGVELDQPCLTGACRAANFTNEIGYGHTVRLLKNIVGLWLLQECRRHWKSEGHDFSYAELSRLALGAPPFYCLINPADPRFISPDEMPAKIAAFCTETGQSAPLGPGATVRCIFESLALLYRRTFHEIERVIGHALDCLHIVGGGSRNLLLNQFTANALQKPIWAGPVEATAAGNVLIQALALGHLPSLSAARSIVASSFDVTRVEPKDGEAWDQAYQVFLRFFL